MMRTTTAIALLLAFAGHTCAQQPNVADLFGPDTAVYLELVKPAAISKEVTPLTKGSVFEDMPAFISKFRDRSAERWWFAGEEIGLLGTFFGPEMLNELGRFQGGAIAITGFKRGAEPDIVGILLTGESNFPGFVMRAFLSSHPMLRSAGQVEGVHVYRDAENERAIAIGPNGNPAPPPTVPPDYTYYAQMPGAILIGTSMESVSDVIKRYKGKEKRLGLTGVAGFKEAAALRERPGIFAFVNTGRLAEMLDTATKGGPEAPVWLQLKDVLNLKAIQGIAACLSMESGHIDVRLQARIVPGQASMLFDIFAGAAIDSKTLQRVPGDASVVASLSLADGEAKFRKLVEIADAMAKGDGKIGATPAELVKEIEEKLKISIGKDVAGQLRGVTIAIPAKQDLPKGAVELPMIVIDAKGEAEAKKLEELAPQLLSALLGESLEPITETIQGQKIRSLASPALPWKTPLHYGRAGALLIFGQDRKIVAASLAGSAKDNLLADPKRAQALQAHESASALFLWQWGPMLADLLPIPQTRHFRPANQRRDDSKINEEMAKFRKALADVTRSMPPMVASVSRQENRLQFAARVSNARDAAPKLIDGIAKYIVEGGEAIHKIEAGTPANPIPVPKD